MTFSIIARNPIKNTIVIGIASKLENIGKKCVFIAPNVGCIILQGLINRELGSKGLHHLVENLSASNTLKYIKEHDTTPKRRQCHIVNFNGEMAHYSGNQCSEWFGHIQKENISIAGNLLTGENVLTDMYNSYIQEHKLSTTERVLKALQAGENAGGDKRGKEAAALYQISQDNTKQIYLHIDNHINPLTELEQLLQNQKK